MFRKYDNISRLTNPCVLVSRQKWFRGRKIHTDWDIRVEQCQFSELAITAHTEEGISVGIVSVKNGQRSVK